MKETKDEWLLSGLQRTRDASRALRALASSEKNRVLEQAALGLIARQDDILAANPKVAIPVIPPGGVYTGGVASSGLNLTGNYLNVPGQKFVKAPFTCNLISAGRLSAVSIAKFTMLRLRRSRPGRVQA